MPIEPTIEPPPTPPEVPDTPLDLRIDGAPLRWRSARAYTRGGRALFVAFSSRARRGCPGNPMERDWDEATVHIRISPVLPSDGAGWRVGYASAFLAPVGLRMVDLRTPAAARIDAPPREVGDSVDGGIDLSSPEITARGRFRAVYCGDEPRTPEPATYDDVHVEVGGETIPIRGARFLIQDDMLRLVLSSNGSACGPIGLGSDVELEVQHHGRLPSPRQTSIYARGHRLSSTPALIIAGAQDDIIYRYDPAAIVPGDTTRAEVRFAGDLRGLPVLVRGFVDAEVCPPL